MVMIEGKEKFDCYFFVIVKFIVILGSNVWKVYGILSFIFNWYNRFWYVIFFLGVGYYKNVFLVILNGLFNLV